MASRGRPSNAYLKTLRSPTRADYDRMVRVAMETIISGSTDVLMAFSYIVKFPDGFPKGILHSKQETVNIYRVKAKKLLTWLNENGYTDITVEALRRQRARFTGLEIDFAILDEIVVDEDQEIAYNAVHQLLNKEEHGN